MINTSDLITETTFEELTKGVEDDTFVIDDGITLSKEQQEAVLEIENSCNTITILTGKAGSGKSTVVRALRERNSHTALCSTTGKSALLIGACTLDSLFKYSREDNECWNIMLLKITMENIGRLIIIDEASMIGSSMFRYICDVALKYNKRLLLVGDWGQAPPVKDDWFFRDNERYLHYMNVIKLKECHRQEDKEFLQVLDKIREGKPDEQVSKMMSTRVTDTLPPDEYVKLFYTNADVIQLNTQKVRELAKATNKNIITLKCAIRYINPDWKPKEEALKSTVKECPLAHDVELCVGCRILITKNNMSSGYVNGSSGILKGIDKELKALIVELDSGVTVKVLSDVVEKKDNMSGKDRVLFSIAGYPVQAGYAMTIHKCQGQTLDKVYADLSLLADFQVHGLTYVALSRVRRLEDLLISAWDNNLVYCDDDIKDYI